MRRDFISRLCPTNMFQRNAQAWAFTLVELLVVISIIVILAGLLLPAASKSIETSKSILCMNKQRQCGLSIGMYSNDYNDKFLPGYFIDGVGYQFVAWSSFVTGVPTHGYDTSSSSYVEYVSDVRCPYQTPRLPLSDNRWVNYCYGSSGDLPIQKGIRRIEHNNKMISFGSLIGASSLPFLTDTAYPADGSWCAKWQWGYWYGKKTNYVRVHLRHGGGTNMMYLDMHCKRLFPGELEDEGILYYRFDDYISNVY